MWSDASNLGRKDTQGRSPHEGWESHECPLLSFLLEGTSAEGSSQGRCITHGLQWGRESWEAEVHLLIVFQ